MQYSNSTLNGMKPCKVPMNGKGSSSHRAQSGWGDLGGGWSISLSLITASILSEMSYLRRHRLRKKEARVHLGKF